MSVPSPHDRLKQRYGDDVAELPLVWSDVIDHLLNHRSVRKYLPEPVGLLPVPWTPT